MRSNTPSVSIIVPTYNRRQRLLRLLATLEREHTAGARFTVIVSIDGATDGTQEALEKLSTPYPLRALAYPNSGPAAARNRAITAADGDILLFLDDDVVPAPGLIQRHLQIHANDPHAVAIGPMLAPQDHHLALWLHWEAATLQKQYRAMRAGEWQPTPRQFYTANASVRREHALAAGCFDERFTRAEDVEFACRLEDLGLRFWFEQQAIVWHEPDRSFSSWLKVPYEYGRFDVLMEQEGRRPFVLIAAQELRRRHPLSRMLQRACVGHPSRVRAARALLGFAIRHGNRALPERLGLALCSALFNLQYWQGVVDESGLGADIWQRLQERAAAHARGETSDTLGVHA